MKLVIKTASIITVLWAVGKFIIAPLNISGSISGPGMITAIVCSTIVFCAVVIPFLIGE